MSIVLANAAFGDDPGRWPLPPASTPHELWLRAVAAGGQGRYGSAMADLAGLLPACSAAARWCRWHTAPVHRSCVSSAGTTGPAGGTAGRSRWPARTRSPVPTPSSGSPPTRSGGAGSRRRPRRCGGPVSCSAETGTPRLPVRLAWVSADWPWPAVRVRRRGARRARRRVGSSAGVGAPRPEIGRRPSGGAVQRRGRSTHRGG